MTTNEKVEYELGLKDNFSDPLKQAEGHAHGFHESVMHIVEALGLLELAHEGIEFFKESFEEFEQHEVALSSLTQMYKNNTDSVGMNVKELEELAEAQEKITGIHSEEIMKAEQSLMKYKQIRVSYEELIPVINDFAKATGQDASEAANTLGWALENPERAARLLMQAGVSPGQQEMYKTLAKTGDAAKAQGYLMEILGEKYKGVAAAMFENNIGAQLDIEMKEVKESVGELVTEFLHALMPAIKAVFEYIKKATEWVKEHKEGLAEVMKVLGILAGGYVTYKIAMIASEVATNAMTAAQWALNAAMDANPIGLVILALTALVAAIYEVYKHWDSITRFFKDTWDELKETAKVIWDGIVSPIKAAFHEVKSLWAAMTGDSKTAAEEQKKATESMLEPVKQLEQAKKNILGREIGNKIADAMAAKEGVTDPEKELEGSGKWGKDEKGIAMKPKSESVNGQSHITINVAMQKMTGIEKLVTQNIKGGADAAGEAIIKMMLGSVNQFAASADL